MNPRQTLHRLASFTPIAATLSLLVPAHADTETWSGTTNDTWDTTTANWLTDGSNNLFESADDALFTGTPTNNVTTATGLTIGAITLDGTFTGSVTMSGANTVSGTTTISGGTLNLNHQTGLGSSAITVNSGGTVNVTLGSDQNVNNVFTGNGILTVSGSTGTPNFNNASALNGFTGTFNINTSGSKKVALTTAGGKIGSGATVNIASGGTLYIANTTASFDGVTFNVVGSGNTENFGAIRIENGSVIGATSSVVLGGDTSLGTQNGTAGTINAVISESTASALTKVGNQTLILGGANTYTGATILTGGTLSVATDTAGAYNLGGSGTNGITFNGGALRITGTTITSFGSHTPTFTATKTVTLDIADAANSFTVSQTLNQTTGQFIKLGAGTLTSSGANTYTGGTRANAGTLVLSGSHTYSGGNTDFISVNNVGAQNAVLKITAGAHGFYDMPIAEAANSRGAVYQSGGTFALNRPANTNTLKIGSGAGSYGYYSLSGGTLSATEVGVGALANDSTGVMEVSSAGQFNVNGWITVGRGGLGSSGVLNTTGGTVTGTRIHLNWAATAGATSILNVGGGGAAAVSTTGSTTLGLDLANSATAGTIGVANLRANGTLTTGIVTAGQANPTALLNFNGGTLQAATTNAGAGFLTNANIDAVTVYSGGGTIDNNGTNITVDRTLAAPTGNGVTSIAVTSEGSGYIGAPMVKISGGTGNTATAYAVMTDDGTGNGTFKVSSIVVTSPGTFSVDPTTVTLTGGGATTAATIGTITTAANTSGGLTFSGAGTTTLTGTNTYTGDTTVTGGILAVDGDAIADTAKLVINGGKVEPTGTEVVNTLFFGAAQQIAGTYGSSLSPATFQDDSRFTGTGVVSVTTGAGGGYTGWANANAPGQTMDQDHDGDGVKNGVEYFMGLSGSAFTANPGPISGTVTWTMGAAYAGVYGTDYQVETSTDLVTWTQVPTGSGDNTVTVNPGASVVYDMPTGGKRFVRLAVTN